MIEISLAAEKIKKKRLKKDEKDEKSHFVIPGDVITDNSEYIRYFEHFFFVSLNVFRRAQYFNEIISLSIRKIIIQTLKL